MVTSHLPLICLYIFPGRCLKSFGSGIGWNEGMSGKIDDDYNNVGFHIIKVGHFEIPWW